jgi:hypothetical protein
MIEEKPTKERRKWPRAEFTAMAHVFSGEELYEIGRAHV